MKREKTNRGFGIINFKDSNGEDCTLQESSASGSFIWFGCRKKDPNVFIPGEGWKDLKIEGEWIGTTRMHLSRSQVLSLIPVLLKFVFTGRI